ncbi:hypothetical protein [Mycolicibacter longobardus]|nr:hypothetical protein [Mycolicibacter longobardus]
MVLTECPALAARCAALGAVVIDTRNIVDRGAVGGARMACLGNGTPGGH